MKAGLLLVGSAAALTTQEKVDSMDITAVEKYLSGIIYGMIEKDDLPEMQKCLKNTEVVATEVKAIISEVSKGDMADIVKGVQDAIKLVQELPTDLSDCKNIQGDVTKITNWGKQFITPSGLTHIVENVMANWSNIQTDIGTINTDIQGSKYEEAGEMTADVVILALGKIQYQDLDKDIDWELLNAHNPIQWATFVNHINPIKVNF